MNKIYPKRNIDYIKQEYLKFVEPKVRQRLNILIGFLLLKEGKAIDLDSDNFNYNGVNYLIGTDANVKKGILNSFFSKDGKNDRVTINAGKLQLPDLNDNSIYKSGICNDTFDFLKFIELSEELKKIIGESIDISPGTFLDNKKAYCSKLSKNEKLIFDEIFPYKLFFQKKEHDWFYASKLADDLNTPVCPYCNREYISSVTTIKRKKIIGPTFDHFLSQKDYPFLKLSFYNLIPSCTTCNSRLKNQKEFDFDYFLYPYIDSYKGIAKFNIRLGVKNIKSIIGKSSIIEEHKLTIRILAKSDNEKLFGPTSKSNEKGNLNVFQTQKIYNDSHKDVAFDILEKFERVPRSHIESTFNILKSLGKNHSEIYRFYFGNYPKEEDFNKRPLARMTRDIVEQLNDIYKLKIFK